MEIINGENKSTEEKNAAQTRIDARNRNFAQKRCLNK